MPDGGASEVALADVLMAEGASFVPEYAIAEGFSAWQAAQVVASVYIMRDQQRRAENRARDAYNAGLKDRYAMVRGATEQRQLVMGRQRVSGPVGFIRSFGGYSEHLALTIILAAHEVGAIERIYFDDEPVTLDGSNNVIGVRRTDQFSIAAATGTFTIATTPALGALYAWAQYGTDIVPLTITDVTGTSVSISGARPAQTGRLVIGYQPWPCPYTGSTRPDQVVWMALDASGAGAVVLPGPIAAGSLHASYYDSPIGSYYAYANSAMPIASLDDYVTVTSPDALPTVSIVAPEYANRSITITWREAGKDNASKARIRAYRGAAGQAADAAFIAAMPGVWAAAHTGTGLAYLACELDYDSDAFPGGFPNVSAICRGALCYDPRDGATRWTENPALLMRWYATHPLGGRLPAAMVNDDKIAAAANVCDEVVTYTVGYKAYTRKRYTAGHTVKCGTRPADALNDLAQAMGGKWCMVDGRLSVIAGAYRSPVAAITEDWLADNGAIQIQPTCARADLANAITGTFCDESQDYQVVSYPKVTAAEYVAADGAELPLDTPMPAVPFSGQAQYIAACSLRYARQGLTIKMTCNLRAYVLEPFDVVAVSLARYGWADKTFEVLDTSFTLDGGIELSLKEIDPSIWVMDANYTAADPAPNTRLPSAWGLEEIGGLAAVNDSTTILTNPDGSKTAAIRASWTAATDARVTQGGTIELRWGLMADAETTWRTTYCAGGATAVLLAPAAHGATYGMRARTNAGNSSGPWSEVATVAVTTAADFTGSVTDVVPTTLESETWTITGTPPKHSVLETSYTNTTGHSIAVEVSAMAMRTLTAASGTTSPVGAVTYITIAINGGAANAEFGSAFTEGAMPGAPYQWKDVQLAATMLAPGDTAVFRLSAAITGPYAAGSTLKTEAGYMRVTALKA